MWDLPGPGLEPVSPALAGGFLTTAPPGEPRPGNSYWNNVFALSSEMTNGGINLTGGLGSLLMLKICKNIPASLNGAVTFKTKPGM